jgi:hypothetical protein
MEERKERLDKLREGLKVAKKEELHIINCIRPLNFAGH